MLCLQGRAEDLRKRAAQVEATCVAQSVYADDLQKCLDGIADSEASRFLSSVVVIILLRSDFYPRYHEQPTLVALAHDGGRRDFILARKDTETDSSVF